MSACSNSNNKREKSRLFIFYLRDYLWNMSPKIYLKPHSPHLIWYYVSFRLRIDEGIHSLIPEISRGERKALKTIFTNQQISSKKTKPIDPKTQRTVGGSATDQSMKTIFTEMPSTRNIIIMKTMLVLIKGSSNLFL